MTEAERIVADFEEAVAKYEANSNGFGTFNIMMSNYWDKERSRCRDLLLDIVDAAVQETDAEDEVDAVRASSRQYGKTTAATNFLAAMQRRRDAVVKLRDPVDTTP